MGGGEWALGSSLFCVLLRVAGVLEAGWVLESVLPPTLPHPLLSSPSFPPQVLADDEKKGIYDRFGEAGLKGGAMGGGGFGGGGMGGAQDFSNPFDIFETFFGGGMGGGGGFGGGGGMGGRSRTRPVQGDDQRYDLQLDFLEAVFGAQREIDVSRLEGCETCSGSGVKAGASTVWGGKPGWRGAAGVGAGRRGSPVDAQWSCQRPSAVYGVHMRPRPHRRFSPVLTTSPSPAPPPAPQARLPAPAAPATGRGRWCRRCAPP